MIQSNFVHDPKQHAPKIAQPLPETAVLVESYTVYDLPDIPFRFVLAKLNVTNNQPPLQFDLFRIKTDEGLYLNDIDEFKSEISSKGYDLTKQNVTNRIFSETNVASGVVLIPIKNNYRQKMFITITGSNQNVIEFDLTTANGNAADLGKTIDVSNETLIESDNQQTITAPQSIEGNISESLKVDALELIDADLVFYKITEGDLRRINFSKKTRIAIANLHFDFSAPQTILAARLNYEDKYLYFSLDQRYIIQGANNVLNVPVAQGSGVLIFQLDDLVINPLDEKYSIEIKMDQNQQWQQIPVNQ